MKHSVLALLLVGCLRSSPPAYPNRVCMMVALDAPGARCADAGSNALHGDIARRDEDGGTKICWESFDQDGYHCATPVLSKKETAALAVRAERERTNAAKLEADAKAKGNAADPKPPDPDPKKP